MMPQAFVDKDAFVPFLVMQPATLLDVNRHQSGNRHDQHGDETGELAQDNGEYDKADE